MKGITLKSHHGSPALIGPEVSMLNNHGSEMRTGRFHRTYIQPCHPFFTDSPSSITYGSWMEKTFKFYLTGSEESPRAQKESKKK
jgi:hypothetical protein